MSDIEPTSCFNPNFNPSCDEQFDVLFGTGDGDGQPRTVTKDQSATLEEIDVTVNDWAIALFEELKFNQERTGKKLGWIYYRLLESERASEFTLGDWRYFAKRMGYKPKWAYHKYQEAQRELEKEKIVSENSQPVPKTEDLETEDLQKIWRQILKRLQSPRSRALFTKFGKLLDHDNGSVIVGLTTPPLLAIAKRSAIKRDISQACCQILKLDTVKLWLILIEDFIEDSDDL